MKKPIQWKRYFALSLTIIGLILLLHSLDRGFYTLRYTDIQAKVDKIITHSDTKLGEVMKFGNLILYPVSDSTDMLQYRILVFRKSRFVDLYKELPLQQFTLQPNGEFTTVLDTQTTRYFLKVNNKRQVVVESQIDIEGKSPGYEPLFGYMLFCLVIYPFVFKKKKPSNR